MKELLKSYEGLVWLTGAAILAVLAYYVFFKVARMFAKRSHTGLDDSFVKHCRGPSRLLIPLLVVNFLFPVAELPPASLTLLRHAFSLFLIGSIAWMIIKLTYVLEDFLLSQFRVDVKDNLRARRIQTQIQIFKKVVIVIVVMLSLATTLMTFEKVRLLGTSILASAGIAGIIVGLAAQRSVSTLLAGIQVAITQPIRIDDVVIVENEWGRIEEITLTYVVVRIWDMRRLILPITYFIEKAFQNWTRVTADILGTVLLYVDYSVPVKEVRERLHEILADSKLWDGKVWGLQVTNATERTVELRALMSAPDASAAWNLRCEVREKLIEYIRKQHPCGLPVLRATIRHEKDEQMSATGSTNEAEGV